MKKHSKLGYILLGALISLLVCQLTVPSLAALAGKTIDVFTGVNIYVDDVKLSPKDANGNSVEPFVYNGTTYLPVRAVGEACGKTVQWEASSQSVYMGKHSSNTPAVMLQDLDYFTGGGFVTGPCGKDNLGNTYNNYIVLGSNLISNVYKINGQYSRITGTLYQTYDARSEINMDIYLQRGEEGNVAIYGDGKKLFYGEVGSGVEPIYFDIDLTGVLELRVDFFDCGENAALGDCGLYT